MSKEAKESAGTWLYRALAIYFLWNIYVDVSSIDVIKSKIEKHESEINRLQNAVFTQVWIKRSTPEEKRRHERDTRFLEEYSDQNIRSAKEQIGQVDSFYQSN